MSSGIMVFTLFVSSVIMPDSLTSKPVILLIVLAIVGSSLYLYRGCVSGPTLAVQVTRGPDGVTFLFNGRVGLEELIVTADPDGEARVVWHLVPRVDDAGDEVAPRPNMAITYGRSWGLGMRPASDTPRNGTPLEPGVTYEFFADTTAGKARARFTMPDA